MRRERCIVSELQSCLDFTSRLFFMLFEDFTGLLKSGTLVKFAKYTFSLTQSLIRLSTSSFITLEEAPAEENGGIEVDKQGSHTFATYILLFGSSLWGSLSKPKETLGFSWDLVKLNDSALPTGVCSECFTHKLCPWYKEDDLYWTHGAEISESSMTAKTGNDDNEGPSVEEGDTTLQKTARWGRCLPSKVASYTFHQQINKSSAKMQLHCNGSQAAGSSTKLPATFAIYLFKNEYVKEWWHH